MKSLQNLLARFHFSNETWQLLKLSLPIILSSLLQMTYNLTDMFWVGKLGSEEIAAVGTSGFFFHLGWSVASIITMGAMVLISQNVGSKNIVALQQYTSTSIVGILIIGLLYASTLLFLPHHIIGFFEINNMQVVKMAEHYLQISSFTMILLFLNLLFTAILNSHGKTRLSFHSVLYGNIINIILDPLFILVFKGGVEGAAWATLLSQLGSSIYFFSIIYRYKLIHFEPTHFKFQALSNIIRIGSSVAIQRILFTAISIIIGRFVAEWGTEAIAAQKLGVQIESLSFLLMGGLSQALSILVGQSFGGGYYSTIERLYHSGLKTTGILGIVTTTLFIAFPDSLLRIFIEDPLTIEIGSSYLCIVGMSQLFMALDMLTCGTYNGQGLTKLPAGISIFFSIMRIPIAIYLSQYTSLGINGIWWSISFSSMFKGITLSLIYRRRSKVLSNM